LIRWKKVVMNELRALYLCVLTMRQISTMRQNAK